jgi:glycosyltransferase involved in cell wall biosynthesis
MHKPTVHILLATYNGAQFLTEQLDSIARQTHSVWTLTISDDGSTDNTLALVAEFAARISQPLTVLQGPRQKSSTRNFCHLIQNAPAAEASDLYAFCDQDDVWLENKLERAVEWHGQQQSHAVRLYCSRTQFVDEQLKPIGLSPGIQRPPSFGNALVQNIASGNTMVMSHDVLLAQKKVKPEHSVWHDWTTYLVATALGGIVCFDDQPTLLYRQHGGNVIGANNGLTAQIMRLKPLFNGRFKQWTDTNLSAMRDLNTLPTHDSLHLYSQFEKLRQMPAPWHRLNAWRKLNIRRQKPSSTLSLAVGLICGLS